jgi:hypothetical protein
MLAHAARLLRAPNSTLRSTAEPGAGLRSVVFLVEGFILQLGEGYLTYTRFRQILRRIERTTQTGSRSDASRGILEVDRPGGQTLEHAGPVEQSPEKALWCLFPTVGGAGWSRCGALGVIGGRRNWLHIGNPD